MNFLPVDASASDVAADRLPPFDPGVHPARTPKRWKGTLSNPAARSAASGEIEATDVQKRIATLVSAST